MDIFLPEQTKTITSSAPDHPPLAMVPGKFRRKGYRRGGGSKKKKKKKKKKVLPTRRFRKGNGTQTITRSGRRLILDEEEDEFGVVVVRASMHITQERRCRPIDGVIYFDNEKGLEAHLHTALSSETSFCQC
ncbi:hypothetical protein CDAR_498721 [Caerostris darwini]|uniref:Uncharacterized protein n=1 Tax=Caerostris darwini TaxID=1538125 RepID=A0AAV4SKE4_9ARAC|nr:hypothetical protein CDAR_498721 [Caerostris darwini]